MSDPDIHIGRVGPTELAEVLRDYERFWGAAELPRQLHHPMFVEEFGDTAFMARRPDGAIVGYLLGFVAPTGDGYIHLVAARDDARGLGIARRLYEVFADAARRRGAVALKAITNPENARSLAFHRSLGFHAALVRDYGGAGRPRIVLRRSLERTT